MWEDNTNLPFERSNLNILLNTVSDELIKIKESFSESKLPLNIEKNNFSLFHK